MKNTHTADGRHNRRRHILIAGLVIASGLIWIGNGLLWHTQTNLFIDTAVAPLQRTASPHHAKASVKPPAASSNPAAYEHTGVITTVFWVGEPADGDNGDISNTASTWDDDWQQHYGGVDSPNQRSGGYLPAAFMPHENSFYVALPYSDFDSNDHRKSTAQNCLASSGNSPSAGSWCKNIWLKITLGERTVYAQWEDAGPFGEDDSAYVFGEATPSNNTDERAGLDISPASRDYLLPGNQDGSDGTYRTSWQFVPSSAVPDGPWKQTITTTPGRPASS